MPGNRPKLAAITTVYRKHSHTQHIVDLEARCACEGVQPRNR